MSNQANHALAVTWPAIFATFCYAGHNQASHESLIAHLRQELGLREDSNKRNKWYGDDRQRKIRYDLTRFMPLVAHVQDLKIVQLVLSDTEEDRSATDVWSEMLAELERVLNDETLRNICGYTLAYQAVIPDPTDQDQTFSDMLATIKLDELIKTAKRPHLPANPKPLAETKVLSDKGQMWLINIPNLDHPTLGHQMEKGTVYLALSLKQANNDMVNKIIFRQSAALFMPDLIAHKGYNQIRQYRLYDAREQISPQIRSLAHQTTQRLQKLKPEIEIDELANKYGELFGYITQFDRVRISLARQLYNYDLWKEEANLDQVTRYHEKQLLARLKELELIVGEGQSILQATDTAVTIIQTRTERRIERLLAVAGIALMVSQIINESAAEALLNLAGWSPPYDRLLTLGVQFAITIGVILVSILVPWLIASLKRQIYRISRRTQA